MRPTYCKHVLYPKCGCGTPPALATHLIVERDRKAKEKRAPKRGRPKITYQLDKPPEEEFLDHLPDLIEDPYTRAELMRQVNAQLAREDFSEFCRQAWHVVEPVTMLEWNWHHELICQVMQGIFQDWEHAQDDEQFIQQIRNVALNVPPGSLKPVCEEGLVTERSRGLVKLKTIDVGDEVLTHRGRFRTVLAVSKQGLLPVIEFTTLRGRKIRAAEDHPMLTQRGWVRADEATTRDVFAAVHLARTEFDQVLNADPVVSIVSGQSAECRCLQVEEDSSFCYQGVAVHNSRLTCVFLPAWMWLRRPGLKLIALSVNENAAMRDARDSRDLIRSDWFQGCFQPTWQIKDDQTAASNYGNTMGGTRISKAQGAAIIGERGDILLIDDANDPIESESKAVREGVNNLFQTNIYNRVNHPERSIRIGIQQRVHAEDWTGFVTKPDGKIYKVWTPENPDPNLWLHVVIPAEFEPERRCVTPWGADQRTTKGEVLHPKRMTPEWLANERRRFGTHKYAGQMQQRPTLAEGGTVKMRWFRHFHYDGEQVPTTPVERKGEEMDKLHLSRPVAQTGAWIKRWDFDWTVISLDPAAKKTERGSQHGILVIAGKENQRYILDDKTCRGDVLDVLSIVEQLCRRYDPNRILIEAKAAGPALMTLFEERFQRGKIVGSDGRPISVVVDPIEPQGDKAARLDACIPELEAGLVHLHDGAEWLDDFTGEVCGYPLASYDDRVDALSQALNHMRSWGNYQLPSW